MFEGIGGVIPLMALAEDRKTYITLLKGCLLLLCFTYIAFAELCYYTFGENLNAPIIMNMMPNNNMIIVITKFIFIINLVFSYPLVIYMTNQILEAYLFSSWKKRSKCRKWSKNFSRSMVLASSIIVSIYFADTLDKVLALTGTIFGTAVVMTIPTLCHYSLIAETRWEKLKDEVLIVVSIAVSCLCTQRIISTW